MSLIELKSFNAVAIAGGFVRAAELLHRSQPTVTAQLRALEKRYDVELFFRSRGQLAQLTPIGRQLFETTRTLFQLAKDALAVLDGVRNMAHATLRFGVIAPRSAMTLVGDYARRHPDVHIEMRIGNSAQILQWLRSYEVDVGILGAHERDPMLYLRRFATPEIVLLAAAGRHYGGDGRLTREAFAGATLILREAGSETRALIEDALQRHG
ncbi:MAG TPA: LysR substrate-binding domain-containing protein [Accumulibacter sp.]|uniref:LysR family transcriptional regulator n=1 Tax=Accumulibacter sp. TaxID=2053492 RepID=UPI0028787066|nr:LysR substrate-binding domain-containing protein [Accumulibacter sp.]MDS4055808.1 LysR substrate-binding domain-containing protein [Accumulibacter sp.]HMV06090.1 LysR substrate-binding domain-containing protein [Accumulibacter sp.]HMW64205.1 LysR substrate-binding domain-containing protein [Accumulibacter sp.]HMW81241.1 LysR substrate-binding domain-containing protein [Accumulibacter sp.]HNB69328.1 LysR substrate-binding domain-containing protein [Accumulibacter sp.]